MILLGILAVCVFQDLKHRGIHLLVFPIFLSVSLFLNFKMNWGWKDVWISSLFLTIVLIILFIYISLKNKKLVNIFQSHLGFGDVLFLICIIPLFSLRNFILFFIAGMIFSMVMHFLFQKFQKHKTIPLAGYLSILVFGLIVYSFFNPSFLKMDIL